MTLKNKKKTGIPVQVFLDQALAVDFDRVIKAYGVSRAGAVTRLIEGAIESFHIPGFIKKDRMVENSLAASNKVDQKILDAKLKNEYK